MKWIFPCALTMIVLFSLIGFNFYQSQMRSGDLPESGETSPTSNSSVSDDIAKVVEEMRGINMQLPGTARSDGKLDLVEEKKNKIRAKLARGGQKSIPHLINALEDKDVQMRRNVCLVLADMSGTWSGLPHVDVISALPALLKATGDKDPSVRAWACQAIGTIGPRAKESIARLKELLNDPDEGVRNSAEIVLTQIDVQPPVVVIPSAENNKSVSSGKTAKGGGAFMKPQ